MQYDHDFEELWKSLESFLPNHTEDSKRALHDYDRQFGRDALRRMVTSILNQDYNTQHEPPFFPVDLPTPYRELVLTLLTLAVPISGALVWLCPWLNKPEGAGQWIVAITVVVTALLSMVFFRGMRMGFGARRRLYWEREEYFLAAIMLCGQVLAFVAELLWPVGGKQS